MIRERLQLLSKSLNEFTLFTPKKKTKQVDVLRRIEMLIESVGKSK